MTEETHEKLRVGTSLKESAERKPSEARQVSHRV